MCNGAICGEALEEIVRIPDGKPRWCFQCHAKRAFEYVVMAPVDRMSYYGPTRSIECASCHLTDGDLFPGRFREWED